MRKSHLLKKNLIINPTRKKTNAVRRENLDKSDDPIRMYLREMGGVELLSREGEIAIAKRIEAEKDGTINALTQSQSWKKILSGKIK